MKKLLFTCVIVMGINTSLLGQMRPFKPSVPFESYEAAKSFLESQEAEGQFSGAVLVERYGKELTKEAYGMADVEYQTPMKTDTKINLGSINKAFTAVSVMQLVDAQKIKLTDKIVDYIPELQMDMADEITVMNLLEMKSGLGSYWDSERFLAAYATLKDMEDYVPIIAEYQLNSKPGTQRAYSNSSYELLGVLVQRVIGQNYYDYVRENVYHKAGMKDTDAFERDMEVPNRAHGYSKYKNGEPMGPGTDEKKNKPFIYNVNDRSPVKGTAAGGGYSTLDDLRKFVKALTSNQLLSKASTDMVINHFREAKTRNAVYAVRGGSYGINSTVFFDTDTQHLVIVMCNYDPPTASEIMRRLRITGV
ncbi:serine hydrolase domain-containing protein [Flagellimonas myxillae]|uniref:serine hydrolase domain-containing protein n=1 Tax=Flagellimonas myxillae TaxID=2942214 RepID=UPI00201E8482|nr:serine hydrolase domain-containing protein [Muricauda myxillae]MCL6266334.1 beta-lactamase family protein [Muricauda myxillae]